MNAKQRRTYKRKHINTVLNNSFNISELSEERLEKLLNGLLEFSKNSTNEEIDKLLGNTKG